MTLMCEIAYILKIIWDNYEYKNAFNCQRLVAPHKPCQVWNINIYIICIMFTGTDLLKSRHWLLSTNHVGWRLISCALPKLPVGRGFFLVSYIMLCFSCLFVLQKETSKRCHIECYTTLNLLRPCTAALTVANSFPDRISSCKIIITSYIQKFQNYEGKFPWQQLQSQSVSLGYIQRWTSYHGNPWAKSFWGTLCRSDSELKSFQWGSGTLTRHLNWNMHHWRSLLQGGEFNQKIFP